MRTFAFITMLLAASVAGAQTHGAVIASDLTSAGTVGLLNLESPWTVTADLTSVNADANGRWRDGLVYIVNRAGADNIQVLDPAADLGVVRQFSLGLGRNIHDIAFLDDGTAYVSCYDTAELLHIDPVSGAILQVISTAAFADADGLPETSRLHLIGDRLFLSCERLDRDGGYQPVGDSYLLVLDTVSRSWIDCDLQLPGTQGVRLAATNPYTDLIAVGGRLLVGCIGTYTVNDGGVEVVDPVALVSLGLEITDGDLGGDVVALAGGPDGRRHVIISDPGFDTRVKAYRVGAEVQTLAVAPDYYHAAVAWDGDLLVFVADRTVGAAGVRVYDAVTGLELTTAPVETGLPPALFILPEPTAVPVVDLPSAGLSLSPPWPNPANPGTRISFRAPAGTSIHLRLVDLRGRLVRGATLVADADGRGAWDFDGRDRQGRPVASGAYRCVVENRGGFAARGLTIVR